MSRRVCINCCSCFLSRCRLHIPSKTSSVSSVQWITPEIRRKKIEHMQKQKRKGSSKHKSKFETLRREIKSDCYSKEEQVTKLLKGLNPSKALVPDELQPRGLKDLATELGSVFAHLFHHSIDTGDIPKEWPLANICPPLQEG